jgi:hypothetical protein
MARSARAFQVLSAAPALHITDVAPTRERTQTLAKFSMKALKHTKTCFDLYKESENLKNSMSPTCELKFEGQVDHNEKFVDSAISDDYVHKNEKLFLENQHQCKEMLYENLDQCIQDNEIELRSECSGFETVFHGPSRSFSPSFYIERMMKYSAASPSCIFVSFIYLERLQVCIPKLRLSAFTIQRLLLLVVMEATNFLEDVPRTNAIW